uniref:BED-type domain-containing protein n=1 Tax=Crocodylus porosus TaxID=8502 RepID=A0A7M4FQ22_CROPO
REGTSKEVVEASGSAESASPLVVPLPAEEGNKAGSTPSTQKRGSSGAWDHSEVADDPMYATCQHCWRQISQGKEVKHFTTTAMLLHLRSQPPLALLPPQPGTSGSVHKRKSPSHSKYPVPTKQRQGTLEQWGKAADKVGCFARASEITQSTGEMLALDERLKEWQRAGLRKRVLNCREMLTPAPTIQHFDSMFWLPVTILTNAPQGRLGIIFLQLQGKNWRTISELVACKYAQREKKKCLELFMDVRFSTTVFMVRTALKKRTTNLLMLF